jgi:hypothetical protein
MRRIFALSVSLALGLALLAAPAAATQDNLAGTVDISWNACYGAPPSEQIPDWIGTADIDGDTYDIIFFNIGSGRPPTLALEPPEMAAHEIWAIYDGLELVFDEECAVETFEGDVVMWGHDYGVANFAESPEYVLSGMIREAFGDYADYAGHGITFTGTVEFDPDTGGPLSSSGSFVTD